MAALRANEFKALDPMPLVAELGLRVAKCKEYFRELGCKWTQDKRKEGGSGSGQWVTLTVTKDKPLKFPVLRRPSRRRR